MTPLDTGRDKVYVEQERFFSSLTPGRGAWQHPSITLERAEELVANLCAHFKVPELAVTKKNQPIQAAAYSRKFRTIRLYGISPKWVLLHEFAHALVDWRVIQFASQYEIEVSEVTKTIAGHGPAFLQAYIDVVEAQWGHVDGLVDSFKTHMTNKTGITPSNIVEEWYSNLSLVA